MPTRDEFEAHPRRWRERTLCPGRGKRRASGRARDLAAALLALLALGAAAAPAEPLVHGTNHDIDPSGRANQGGKGALRPVLGKAVDVSPVSGRVLVRLRGRHRFIALQRSRTIPVGSLVDTKRGTVALTSASDADGHTQTGQFGGGVFKVLQGRSSDGLTVLRLWGGGFSACAGARPSSFARASPRVIRKLRARARRGRFRTRGRYSASTVRGTVWTTIDRCDGTLTKVKRGTVVVRDLRRRLTVVVHAGSSYLARASGAPPPAQHTLTLTKTGTGSGTLTSSPAGIDCGATCSAQFVDGSSVTLTAVADPGSSFSGWAGCDSVAGNQCTVSMTADRTVTATLTAAPVQRTLTMIKDGTGTGTVTSSPAGIDCGATCSAQFVDGSSVTLTAVADPGSSFSRWAGCDSVAGNQCTVSMTADRTVTATFTAAPVQRTLTLTKNGNGSGRVTSSPAGIDCGATCSAQFVDGTSVTLTAVADAGFISGWAGCDSVSVAGDQCTVSMTANRAVTATFTVIG